MKQIEIEAVVHGVIPAVQEYVDQEIIRQFNKMDTANIVVEFSQELTKAFDAGARAE